MPLPETDRALEELNAGRELNVENAEMEPTAEKEIKNFVAWYVAPLKVTKVWPSLMRFALMETP